MLASFVSAMYLILATARPPGVPVADPMTAAWVAFWANLPYLIGAFGTCVVPGVTAFLLVRAHQANLRVAAATRAEVAATRTEMTEVKGLVSVATMNVEKIERKTNSMHDKIVELTDLEASARGHLAGRAEALAEEKAAQAAAPPKV